MERGEPDGMNFVLAAGGTGGHMVPAHALAAELKSRAHGVLLITDERGTRFPGLFEDVPVHVLPAGRIGGGPVGWLRAAGSVLKGRSEAKALYREHTPDAVVGFGGYPAFPSLLAASSRRIPTVLHEQNAVLGRVNRLLAGEAAAIATAYEQVDRLKSRYEDKTVLVGNPVREEIARLGELPYPPFDEIAPLKILVTGGSQGASVLSEVVPKGLGMLHQSLRHRLQVVQQCRPDDIERVRKQYADLGIPAELLTYIEDMPDKLADAHLFIGRAGASTIAELTAAGRPAILIPYPSATDDHQTANAREMTKAGGARTIQQDNFTPDVLARQIEAMAQDPVALNNAAARALSVGRPHAARDLADLVERVGNGVAPVAVGPALTPRVRGAVPAGGMPA
jgi:UDP-N-acetylglucosamine--N-acetylmuramyl-(pentapeptide) pyrophosphoryl-undecaprenol N-acetylglucosamine transferase